MSDVVTQVQEMRTPVPDNAKTTETKSPSSSGSGGDTLSSVASTVLKSGFGLAPLVSGLISLFGGDDSTAPEPLLKYALPPSIDFQAAETSSGITGVDYDQSGTTRIYPAATAPVSQNEQPYGSDDGARANAAAPQITVNVQAMDARSFMDRSNEIALAVRDAMLNMNAINDVVNEL
jgi:hypothetical protein